MGVGSRVKGLGLSVQSLRLVLFTMEAQWQIDNVSLSFCCVSQALLGRKVFKSGAWGFRALGTQQVRLDLRFF